MINRVKEKMDGNFTMLPNEVFTGHLSPKTIGVFSYLLSKPDDWNFNIPEIADHFSCGITAIRTAIKELETKNMLLRVNIYNDKGKITRTDYILYPSEADYIRKGVRNSNIRKPNVRKPNVRKPNVRFPNGNNTDSNNTDSNNTDSNNNSLSESDNSDTDTFEKSGNKNSITKQKKIDDAEFCQKVFDRYNHIAEKKGLQKHRKLSADLRKKILARKRSYKSWKDWSKMFDGLRRSKYFGHVDRSEHSWFSLKYIVRSDDTFEKVMSGWMEWKAEKKSVTPKEELAKGEYTHGKEYVRKKMKEFRNSNRFHEDI